MSKETFNLEKELAECPLEASAMRAVAIPFEPTTKLKLVSVNGKNNDMDKKLSPFAYLLSVPVETENSKHGYKAGDLVRLNGNILGQTINDKNYLLPVLFNEVACKVIPDKVTKWY